MMDFLDANLVVAVCFVIFIYLSYRPVKKAIIASLDARIAEIKTKLKETEKVKDEAKLFLDEIEKEIKDFKKRQKQVIESAESSTEKLVETRGKELERKLARSKESALKYIATEKVRAGEEMKAEFINSVVEMVRSYLIETKNNSVSDEEIFSHLTKKK